ncbi:MAG: 1,6-anhydro-N-acetylmuramyl-L-alanine amidase AmpD [Pseudomonadales bacterium]|nr:1,6-anhydro-N-acetylmuramyl-L-alanine amidase AmpD [Pseudomonadales bacterium]
MHIEQHKLKEAQFIASPNHSERPDGAEIDLLVIHNISLPPGEFGTGRIAELFCNELDCSAHPYFSDLEDLRVSAHLLIERDGHLIQFVPFDRKAWHAGESEYRGRKNCNEFSIGIELEGTDEERFTDHQYECLAAVTQALLRRYPGLTVDRIVGHSDIAPQRKTDPGPCFDWQRFQSDL